MLAGASGSAFPLFTVAAGTLAVAKQRRLGRQHAWHQRQQRRDPPISKRDLAHRVADLSGVGTSGNGALENLQGTNSWTGAITLAADSQVNVDAAADTLTLSGNIGGGFALTKGGAGNLVLSGGNTFTGGSNVLGGTLTRGQRERRRQSSGPLGSGRRAGGAWKQGA